MVFWACIPLPCPICPIVVSYNGNYGAGITINIKTFETKPTAHNSHLEKEAQ